LALDVVPDFIAFKERSRPAEHIVNKLFVKRVLSRCPRADEAVLGLLP